MSKATRPSLWDRMRWYAAEHGEPTADWLTLAQKLEDTTEGFLSDPQKVSAQQFLGHYARARRAWCDVTGEPLV